MEIERPKYQVTTMALTSREPSESRFSATLAGAEHSAVSPGEREASPGITHGVSREIATILEQEADLDQAMSASLNGESLNQREMLELQATVYSYSQRVDVATRVIDRGASALKQLLNTQL